jgi:D-amino-acid dehydrogenase
VSQASSQRVAVIGGGITGITTAYKLVKAGCAVTLFDRHPYPAMETSFANGGQLSASNAQVWNSWATVLKGIKWMFSPGAPLLVSPKPSWHKLSWMAEFIAAIPRHEHNTITTVRMALEARELLKQMASEEGIDFDCEDRGILHFYKNQADFDAGARASVLLAKGGLQRRAVTPQEIESIEPTLKGPIYAGIYTDSDFSGDIHKFTVGLAKACVRLGADLQLATLVSAVKAHADGVTITSRSVEQTPEQHEHDEELRTFDQVVVCSGVMSRDLAKDLGDRVNVYPVKGYSITVDLAEDGDRATAPWTSLLDDQAKIVASRLGASRFRVAGTAEFNGYNKNIEAARIEPLITWCRRHFPGMSTRHCVPWAGLRPMMPDMMPRVMRGQNPRVFYNTGHGHLGWTLSAVTADLVSAMVMASPSGDQRSSEPLRLPCSAVPQA